MLSWEVIVTLLTAGTYFFGHGAALSVALIILGGIFCKYGNWKSLVRRKWIWTIAFLFYLWHTYIHVVIGWRELVATSNIDDSWHIIHFSIIFLVVRPHLFGSQTLAADRIWLFITILFYVGNWFHVPFIDNLRLFNGVIQIFRTNYDRINKTKETYQSYKVPMSQKIGFLIKFIYSTLFVVFSQTNDNNLIGDFLRSSNVPSCAFWADFIVLFWKFEISATN